MPSDKTITIITGNFYPEDTAIGLYTTKFAKFLSENGFKVNVITGFPYYPAWKISEEYKNKDTYIVESIDGIKIFRYKQSIPSKINFYGRVKLMLSILYGTIINTYKIKNTNLVFCIVPFTTSIIPAAKLAKKTNAKLWVHIQDLEFDLAIESGVFNNRLLSGFIRDLLFRTERYLLNKPDIISSISYSMIAKINSKNKNHNCVYFPNWINVDTLNLNQPVNHNYIDKTKFSLLYSGNIGEKQNWDFFIRLCRIIKDPDIEIIIVGDGAYANKLKQRCSDFTFVKFYPLVDYSELGSLLCSPSAHFLFQKIDVVDTVMPSKLLGMMASAKPSIVTGNESSEIKQIFDKSAGGLYISTNDENIIYRNLLDLKNDSTSAFEMGRNARKFVTDNFSENNILDEILSKINILLN